MLERSSFSSSSSRPVEFFLPGARYLPAIAILLLTYSRPLKRTLSHSLIELLPLTKFVTRSAQSGSAGAWPAIAHT